MRKLSTLFLFTLVIYSIFSQVGAAPSGAVESDNKDGELVDIKADLVFPHKVNDTLSVLCLVGNFAAQHNGAVITADSAVRYEDERLECFGNVLINKNTTYAYCDRAYYVSEENLATLYSPIVKVVDEDVTLYTHNFEFNTLDNVGRYWGGGVTLKLNEPKEGEEMESEEPQYDVMESRRGYYYADTKSVVGVDAVELKGAGYLMTGDSVLYDMANERAHFMGSTNIWNEDNDYIYGDSGFYDKAQELYSVTSNGYLLTKEQEIWGDSMEYYRAREEAILRNNIQIVDTTNKSIGFGDFAQYWGAEERILMTRDPLLINYDTEQPSQPIDSLYLRGDTMELISYALGTGPFSGEVSAKKSEDAVPEGMAEMMAEEEAKATPTEQPNEEATEEHDHDHDHDHEATEEHDHDHDHDHEAIEEPQADTTQRDKKLDPRELKLMERKAKEAARVTAFEAREHRKLEERRDKMMGRIEKKRLKQRSIYSDSMLLTRIVAEIESRYGVADTMRVDTTIKEETKVVKDSTQVDSIPERDSLYRVFVAYGNVRAYRRDVQMVCDSMVANSYDTVLNLYVEPVLWSDKNQVTAQRMDIYTKAGDLDYADFIGDPVMASLVVPNDTTYINQVVGKDMRAFFVNNEIVRNDVNSNVQTIYFMQDEQTGEVNTIAFVESGSASFLIEAQQLDGIIYRQSPTYTFAPLDLRPTEVPLLLEGFKWEESRRPTLSTIMNRTLRPSERAAKSSVPRPTFPLEAAMNQERERLESQKVWTDRIEKVSPEATEWMESLGFTPGEPRAEGSGF